MSIKVGDKFIIEIGTIAELPDGKKKYFVKPFESLVFDETGLAQLEPVEKTWENELEKAKLFAYKNGFEHGKKQAINELPELANKENEIYNDGYNKGIEDFENLFVHEHDYEQFFEDTYGSKNPDYNLYDLVAKYGAKKVINDFKKWQEKKKKAEEEIRVGDIIYSEWEEKSAIITHDRGMLWECIDTDGFGFSKLKERLDEEWVKVGHTDELSQLFDKLRGTKIG